MPKAGSRLVARGRKWAYPKYNSRRPVGTVVCLFSTPTHEYYNVEMPGEVVAGWQLNEASEA